MGCYRGLLSCYRLGKCCVLYVIYLLSSARMCSKGILLTQVSFLPSTACLTLPLSLNICVVRTIVYVSGVIMIYCSWVFTNVAFSWLVIVLSSDRPYDGFMSGIGMMYCSCLYSLMWYYRVNIGYVFL
jgi:hypothetical protein